MRLAARTTALIGLLALALAAPASADDVAEATADDQAEAKKSLTEFLEAAIAGVKSKKWDGAKRHVHPKRLEAIATDAKLRGGPEKHGLAPWGAVKELYLTKFEVTGTSPSGQGAVVIATTEEHYSVEDKGVDEGVEAEYLLVPIEGRWLIVDRRLGKGQFPASKVAASYRGYFAGEYELPKEPEKPVRKGRK